MAKGILNISNYSGGLNDKTNPRDIEDNQFQALDSLSIETPGKLKIIGAAEDIYSNISSSGYFMAGVSNNLNADASDIEFTIIANPIPSVFSVNDIIKINDEQMKIVSLSIVSINIVFVVERAYNSTSLGVHDKDEIFVIEPIETTLSYGNGLFHFNADYDMDDTSAYFENNEMLIMNTLVDETSPVADSGLIKFFNLNSDKLFFDAKTSTYGEVYSPVVFSAVDGTVRITPTSFNEGNEPIKLYHLNEEYKMGFSQDLDAAGVLFDDTGKTLTSTAVLQNGTTSIVVNTAGGFTVGDLIKLKKVVTITIGEYTNTFTMWSNEITLTSVSGTTLGFASYSGSYPFTGTDTEVWLSDNSYSIFASERGWRASSIELAEVDTTKCIVHADSGELLSPTSGAATFVSGTTNAEQAQVVWTVSATGGFQIGDILKIGTEYVKVEFITNATTMTVTTDLWGTKHSHSNGNILQIVHRQSWGEVNSIPTARIGSDNLWIQNGVGTNSGRGPLQVQFNVGVRALSNNDFLPTADTGTWFSTTNDVVYIYSEVNYLDGQVSPLKLETTVTSTLANQSLNAKLISRVPNYANIKSIKLYYSQAKVDYDLNDTEQVSSTADYHKNKLKYLLFEVDFRKGIRYASGKDYYPFYPVINNTQAKSVYTYPKTLQSLSASSAFTHVLLGSIELKDKPETVSAEVHIDRGDLILGKKGTGYKTSTIANRRLYIGHVTYSDPTTKELKLANDTIFKSRVNEFDTFTYENRIDVEINDGDDIIALESLGSKLLEFKRNHLYVINIARDIEFLESTLEYKGIEKDYHVLRGEGFIAWFNKFGFYLYDGKQVRDLLLDKNGQQRLVWDSYYNDKNVIGYDPTQKNIYILTGSATASNKQTLLSYDLKSRGLSFRSKATSAKDITNIVNNNDGQMLWLEQYNATSIQLRKFNIEPSKLNGTNGSNIDEIGLKTKEFTFGKPSVDKKIISVYLSYKNGDGVVLYGFTNDGSEEILATLEGSTDTEFKTLHIPIRKAKTEFVDKKALDKLKGFGLRLSGVDVSKDFEINDMQIIFREKSVK